MTQTAALVLANGEIFHGVSIGSIGSAVGEVVFNTSMTGYQEILTDPSYAQQIVTLTYPHIGNTGCNAVDFEACKPWATGLVIRDSALVSSNWRSQQSLSEFLQQHNIIGIAEIDTRRLTRILRDQGAQNACITTDIDDLEAALQQAREFAGLEGMDLAKTVTTAQAYEWESGTYDLDQQAFAKPTKLPWHIVAYDFGVKQNILRLLVDQGCRITVVPAQTPASEVIAMKPHGVLLSNGPGDPAACRYAIKAIEELLAAKIPLFGICLGFQLLALASGAKTLKMKFGHHGANHPVADISQPAQQVMITSQNHGFAVDEASLPETLQVTHRSLFDDTLQGFRHRDCPAIAFQGHPEASPGPNDIQVLFADFISLLQQP